jgi:eukaryotic-like serine/threonine-protein kinase
MVRHDDSIVLIDFGLSLSLHESLMRGQRADGVSTDLPALVAGTGSLPFMAPEQIAGQGLSEACDWYAFGVMLYEALSGSAPFAGTVAEIIRSKRTNNATNLRVLNPKVPEKLAQLVHRLMKVDPDDRPASDEIVRSLSPDGSALESLGGCQSLFIGREKELAALIEAQSISISARRHLVLHVQGEGGIGKTALLRAFLDTVNTESSFLLIGRCRQQEAIPYKAIDELMDCLAQLVQGLESSKVSQLSEGLSLLASLFPSVRFRGESTAFRSRLEGEEPWEIRRRAIQAFCQTIERLAQWKPVVVAIDDLHWGDADSAEFLGALHEAPIDGSVVFVGTSRSGYADAPCVRAFSRGLDNVRLIILEPLGIEDTKFLVESLLSGVRRDVGASAIAVKESRGNPLFASQYASQLQLEKQDEPHSLEDAIWKRSRQLDFPAQEILELVCVAGTRLGLRDVVEAREPDADIYRHIVALRSEKFLLVNGSFNNDTSIEPFHDKIVESIGGRMDVDRRIRCSRMLGSVLAAHEDSRFDLIGRLFEEAKDLSRARSFYLKAGRHASSAYAFKQAVKNFEHAYQLGKSTNENSSLSIADFADALADAGESARSAEMYLEASLLCKSDESLSLKHQAATQLGICGKIDQARALFDETLRQYRVALPSAKPLICISQLLWQRFRLWQRGLHFNEVKGIVDASRRHQVESIWSAAKGLSTTNMLMSASLQTLALRKAFHTGDRSLVANCLAWEAVFRGTCGGKELAYGRTILRNAEALVAENPNKLNDGMIELSRAALFLHEFQLNKAIEHFDLAEKYFLAYRRGAWWELGTVRWLRTTARWHAGRLREMMVDTHTYSEEARSRNDGFTLSNMLAVMHPYICLMQDKPADAQGYRDEASRVWNHKGFHFQHLALLWSELQWLLYNRRPVEAHKRFEQEWKTIKRSMILSNQLVRSMYYDFRATCAIAAASHSKKNAKPLKLANQLAQRIARDDHVAANAFQQRILGGVALLQGKKTEAIDHLRQASERFKMAKMMIHAASVDYRLATLLPESIGSALSRSASLIMSSEGVVAPSRFASIHTWNDCV